jgi:hypothetical protein
MSRNQTLSPTKRKTKRKSAGFNLTPIVAIIGALGSALTIYIGYRASLSDRKLFSISLLALFGGLLFESFRVSDSWKTVITIFIGSYFFSLLSFLPGKREQHYNFENHIQNWPYVLLFFFALAFAIFHKDRVITKLTEGITLLLSLSFIYWTIDYGFTNYNNWFAVSVLSVGFLFTTFSILNALTNMHLSKGVRLTLSIWSTIILFAFAIDNIIRVFGNPDIENSYLSDGLYIGLQYFFLGVSSVYIMQNYMLLAAFLPSKNGNYKNDLRENKKDHIDRFSDQQVSVRHSLFCILYAGTIYWLNYTYQILPRHTMIWLVITTFPLILFVSTIVNGRKSYS